MARGWESKDIESQLETAEADRRGWNKGGISAAELEQRHKREHIELSRRRVALDIEAARHPRHRQQLERALQFLDEELRKLAPIS